MVVGLNLVFMNFSILVDFVKLAANSTFVEDKQLSKAAQDACQKLTEAMNVIVGWQLEQTTWLKRTLVVKHDSSSEYSFLKYVLRVLISQRG